VNPGEIDTAFTLLRILSDLLHVEFKFPVMITISVLFGRGKQIQIVTGFFLSFLLFVIGALVILTNIDSITLTVMNRLEFGIAVRTVKAGSTSGNYLVSEGVLTYLAGILSFAVVLIKILFTGTAPGTAAFVREILSVIDRFDVADSENIFSSELFSFDGMDDRRKINSKVSVRNHGILE
jgi:hypothetical protein